MGFWKNVGKFLTAPQHFIAKTVEKIGGLMSESLSPILYMPGDFIEKIGQAIDPIFYREETSNPKAVVDINVVCKEYFIEASEKFDCEIASLIKKAENKIDSIENEIILLVPYEIYEEVKNISSESAKLFEDISKNAKDIISEKISLSNEEFKNVLGTQSDGERKEKCRKYISEVIANTMNCSSKEINSGVNSIIQNMICVINNHLNAIKEDLSKSQEKQKEFYSKKDNIGYIIEQFSKQAVDISYLTNIISLTALSNN